MRPLEHLGAGFGSPDYFLYAKDEEVYDMLSERGEDLLDKLYKEYMSEFTEPPIPTLKELNEELKERLYRRSRLYELNSPEIIIEAEDYRIKEIEELIKNKNFLNHNDKEGIIYKKLYEQRSQLFKNSKERKELLKEIFKYNEQCAKELGVDCTPLDDAWEEMIG